MGQFFVSPPGQIRMSLDRRAVFGAIGAVDWGATDIYARSLPVREILNGSVAMLVDHSVRSDRDRATFDCEPEILEPRLQTGIGRADLPIAGPPSQGHSNLNDHTRRDDPGNDLRVSTIAIGIAPGVPAMVLENVPSVVDARGTIVSIAQTPSRGRGYAVAEGVLRFDHRGGWRVRGRHFLIAMSGADEAPGGVRWVAQRRGPCPAPRPARLVRP